MGASWVSDFLPRKGTETIPSAAVVVFPTVSDFLPRKGTETQNCLPRIEHLLFQIFYPARGRKR